MKSLAFATTPALSPEPPNGFVAVEAPREPPAVSDAASPAPSADGMLIGVYLVHISINSFVVCSGAYNDRQSE